MTKEKTAGLTILISIFAIVGRSWISNGLNFFSLKTLQN